MYLDHYKKGIFHGRFRFIAGGLALVCSLTVTIMLTASINRGCKRSTVAELAVEDEAAAPSLPWVSLTFPTPQLLLLNDNPEGVFQPTASARPESAFYGSTRTGSEGGRLAARFHEGLDIAPVMPRVRGLAQDPVFAVADGYVGYINRSSGRSNYGIYVVLLHNDPIGEVYTLYAHLAKVSSDLKAGESVTAGTKLGIMGNTPASIVPLERSHLHFEVGLMLHSRFEKLAIHGSRPPVHGNFNGRNLCGLDPLDFFRFMHDNKSAVFEDFMSGIPAAVEVVVGISDMPDYFRRYPALWSGGTPDQGAVRIYLSDGGLPLKGHPEKEMRAPGPGRAIIARVHEEVLGRNGLRLIVKHGSEWRLTAKGSQWVDILWRG